MILVAYRLRCSSPGWLPEAIHCVRVRPARARRRRKASGWVRLCGFAGDIGAPIDALGPDAAVRACSSSNPGVRRDGREMLARHAKAK
jgi:hypothetical protein